MTPPLEHQPIDQHNQASSHHKTGYKMEEFFRSLSAAGASDLHLKPDSSPHIRANSILMPTVTEPLSAETVEEMALELMTVKQKAFFLEHGSIDLAHELPSGDRFRLNVYRQRGTVAISVRRVTRSIPDFNSLHLPPVIRQVAEEHQGLVLLAGPTGSGKSTTIASMLEYINQTRPCHVVTIEDPIEFIYEDKQALINQREIGIDVEDFESALKYLMREDPDVVLIGEMRDRETFQAALQASETGHLVFGTIHSSGAAQTIGRILDLFPPDSRGLIRQSLAFNLRAVICQKLLPGVRKEVPRLPAVEILLTNPSVKQLLVEARDGELPDIIRAHEREGMQSFTRSLLKLVESDLISPKIAYEAAPNVDELKMLMKGISSGHSGILSR